MGEEIARVFKILSLRIRVLSLTLGESVTLSVYLKYESGGNTIIDDKEVIIEGDEYLGWGTDDAYIIDLVKIKLKSIFKIYV
jgi:hypothetical protein